MRVKSKPPQMTNDKSAERLIGTEKQKQKPAHNKKRVMSQIS
jgi:hypothetical protein